MAPSAHPSMPSLLTRALPWARTLVAAFALALPSCEKNSGTPDWNTPSQALPPPTANSSQPATTPPPATTQAPPSPTQEPTPSPSGGLRFIAYNIENWLTMDRTIDRKSFPNSPKPDPEKKAAITLIARHQPDVLGLCEIGTRDDLAEIQAALKSAGSDLPHSHYTGGSDETRHLGILSKFPITRTDQPAKRDYQLNGTTFAINRGILDATITANAQPFRFLGVHLKSQREVEEGDQELMRQNEAHLLRAHVDSILSSDPNTRLIVYGDFNDTWSTPTLKTIVGTYNTPNYLTAIRANDRQGTFWTHYWQQRDIYSRFDFITVSQALKRATDFKNCRIIDDPEWKDASDHRPVLAIFR